MKPKLTILTGLCLALGVASCLLASCNFSKHRLLGEGAIIAETREVPAFHSVQVSGKADLEIIKQDQLSVRVKNYENLLPYLLTEVKNGQLMIHYSKDVMIMDDALVITIGVPNLDTLDLLGSIKGEMKGDFVGPIFKAELMGNSHLKMKGNWQISRLFFDIMGNGEVEGPEGKGEDLIANLSGHGKVRITKWQAENIKLELLGNGKADVWATKSLEVLIKGKGEVNYYGQPISINKEVLGKGSINQLAHPED